MFVLGAGHTAVVQSDFEIRLAGSLLGILTDLNFWGYFVSQI
jgi:hypothetical protein